MILVSVYIPSEVVNSAEAPAPEKIVYNTKEDLVELTKQYANRYGVSFNTMSRVINCESSWDIEAVGDGGKSHGLVQIHNPSHPKITREQATDPEFAINFLAENLSNGKGNMWTCYRMINK